MANDLAVIPQIEFTPDQVELIKRTVAVGATDDELQLFMYVARKTGLDPFTRQIYAIKRSGKMGIQTGIDGYRVVADRTGKLAGISDPTHTEAEGAKYPLTASVTVKKLLPGGGIADFTATARWSEYNAGGPMWAKMPYLMLGKCAEALALRKAFPADLSGVYTTEEMQQADNAQQEAAVTAEVERQKAAYTPTPGAAATTLVDTLLPPELDWSYQKTTGVLICRLKDVTAKETPKKREYLAILLHASVEGKNVINYWHNSHRAELLAAAGKVCKFMLSVSKDGKFVNVDSVLEIDGKHIDNREPSDKEADTTSTARTGTDTTKTLTPTTTTKSTGSKPESAEFKAQALASVMEFGAEELRELHTRWCKGSWDDTLVKLQEEQERRAAIEEPANAAF